MVLEGESLINAAEREIDEIAFDLLAMQQPMAVDLRFILAVTKINADLERVGDQAVNIAKIFLMTESMPPSASIIQAIGEMGDHAVEMVRTAMDSLRRRDRELCLKLPKMDDPIDRLLLDSLGRSDGDLVAVPIAIADRVMCVIAIATADNAPIACAEAIAAAAGAAFARLVRDASR